MISRGGWTERHGGLVRHRRDGDARRLLCAAAWVLLAAATATGQEPTELPWNIVGPPHVERAMEEAAALCEAGEFEKAAEAYQRITDDPAPGRPRVAEALWYIHAIYAFRLKDSRRDIAVLERLNDTFAEPTTGLERQRWQGSVIALLDAYRQSAPPEWQMMAAFGRRMLALPPERLGDPKRRDNVQRFVEAADRYGRDPAPELVARFYFRLWERGYYREMWHLLAPDRREGQTVEDFLADAAAWEEAHGRPLEVGEARALSADLRRAAFEVDVRRATSDDAAWQPEKIELGRAFDEEGALTWEMVNAPLPCEPSTPGPDSRLSAPKG